MTLRVIKELEDHASKLRKGDLIKVSEKELDQYDVVNIGGGHYRTSEVYNYFERVIPTDEGIARIDQILCENITDEINVDLNAMDKEELIDIINFTSEELEEALEILRSLN